MKSRIFNGIDLACEDDVSESVSKSSYLFTYETLMLPLV